MHKPLVSIIVTCYNAAAWIEHVIASLQAQADPNSQLECVIVDDGSTDATPRLVQTIAASDPRVRLIVQANQGTAGALTAGLRVARGEVICLLSHDCYAASDWIARVVATFTADDRLGIVQGPIVPSRPIDLPIYHCTVVTRPSRSFEGAAVAYRAAAVDAAGRYFDRQLSRYGDDADMAWRILEQGYTACWLDQPTAYHEVVPQPFGKAIKSAWGIQRFALLLKQRPAMRTRLRLGFLWGNIYRYLKMAGLHTAFLALVLRNRRWAIGLLATTVGVAWYESLRNPINRQFPLYVRLGVIPLHRLLSHVVGSYALILGSLRYRSLVV